MATAYAAIVSLMNVLNRIQNPCCPVPLDKLGIQTLFDTAGFLLDFLEDYCRRESEETEGVKLRITDAAYAVEDYIESYIVEQILAESDWRRDKSHAQFFQGLLQEAIHKIDSIREEVIAIKEKKCEDDRLTRCPVSVDLFAPSSRKNTTVGLEEDLVRLMDQLTTHQSSLQTIPVVGMGGIGKTTLARNVYEHPFVVNHFQVRAWVTLSQDYSVEGTILSLLHDIGIDVDESKNSTEPGEQLHKVLFGRKYLIVLDDIWSSVALEEIRRFFPENYNGSRSLLTTRLSNVALSVGSCTPYEMELLNNDKSWDMLSQKVFGQEVCPNELEVLGKQIAKSCKGLPLALVVIGGLLKMSEKTRKYWEDVAENIKFIMNMENDCSRILSLSYNHLPFRLKPCFLYMATFREGYDIRVSVLIRLWVSEGFLKPNTDKTYEEVAVEYLNDLIDRNLIMVGKRGSSGRMKSCVLHDLLRDLCLREAEKEKFLCVIEDDTHNLMQRIKSERRLFMNGSRTTTRVNPNVILLPSTVRSLVDKFWLSPWFTAGFGLLRVLHTLDPYNEPMNILQLVNLRYLALSAECYLQSEYFSSICLLRNLETLFLSGFHSGEEVILPSEIWELRHLRHLIFTERVVLSDPVGPQIDLLLNNLQTLSTIVNFSCDDEVLNIIPNLKKLKAHYDMKTVSKDVTVLCCFNNLVRLHKLETLICSFTPKWEFRNEHGCVFNDLETLKLSRSLRKLTLSGCNVPWEYMTAVGSLPNLEVLKLEHDSFFGAEWNSIEGEFQCLKFLSICSCYLSTWKAEDFHFPRLECLALRHMNLEEIPFGIGEIMSLRSIVLCYVPTTAVISAKSMLEEQQSLGNDDLLIDVRIYPHQKEELQFLEDENNSQFRVFSSNVINKEQQSFPLHGQSKSLLDIWCSDFDVLEREF